MRSIPLLLLLSYGPVRCQLNGDQLLDTLQHTAFLYFWNEANPSNGLIKDRSAAGAPCSIASLGFGLTAICIGADHAWVARSAARDRVLTALRTLWSGPQSTAASGTNGYKGFFYHFLDMSTALRTWDSELSTIDSGLLFAGILFAREYFDGADSSETAIRALADSIYRRADWEWFRNFNAGLLMGWKPGTGFQGYGQWTGYNEAMIMYILGYGSPTHPIADGTAWQAWTNGYNYGSQYGYSYVIFPPLFGHQYSHCWVDFRNIRDAWMRTHGFDYFQNSQRATLAQQAYCAANPGGWTGYSDSLWGITASDAPAGYSARGAPPPQGDDGTLVPTAAISSLPFEPAAVTPVIWNLWNNYRSQLWTSYGFRDAFNLAQNWWGPDVIGIDQGPIIIMIENYRTGMVWSRFKRSAAAQRGLDAIGFQPFLDVREAPAAPDRFTLYGNFPNPFNPSTVIRYDLPAGQAGLPGVQPGFAPAYHVTLRVVNMLGGEVTTLLDGMQGQGEHSVRWDASGYPAGEYFYTIQAGKFTATGKMIYAK